MTCALGVEINYRWQVEMRRALSSRISRFTALASTLPIATSCGSPPTSSNEPDTSISISGPPALTVRSLGQVELMTVTGGGATNVTWSTDASDVVEVVPAGAQALVRSLANGTARVIASAGGDADTVIVTVAQLPWTLLFQLAPVVTEAHRPFRLQLAVLDSLEVHIPSSTGDLSVQLIPNAGGGTLIGPTSFPVVDGIGSSQGLSIDSAGVGYQLLAEGNVAGPGGAAMIRSAPTEPFTVFPVGAGPTGFVLASGTFELEFAPTDIDERVHTLLSVATTLPSTLPGGTNNQLVVRLRDVSRPNQVCTSDDLFESECALIDWSSMPGGLNTPPSGVFLNRVSLGTAAGVVDMFLRMDGSLSEEPESLAPD